MKGKVVMEDLNEENSKWMNFTEYVSKACQLTHETDSFVDVTIIAQNKKIFAHKIVLSASSSFLQGILCEVPEGISPVITLTNINYDDLEVVIKFMYSGEVGINAEKFNSVMEVAQCLQIKGLMEVKNLLRNIEKSEENSPDNEENLDMRDQRNEESDLINDSRLMKMFSLDGEQNHIGSHMDLTIEQELPCIALMEENMKPHVDEKMDNKTSAKELDKMQKHLRRSRKKQIQGTRTFKSSGTLYTDSSLKAAVEDLKKGAKLSETASAHCIPRSTLYLHAKANGALVSVARMEHSEQNVQDAIEAVLGGSSLKQAGDKFKIPKTVLWRRLQKKLDDGVIPNILSQRRRFQDPTLKEKALLALQKGQSISTIAKKLKIPVATVFRQKKYLVQQGILAPSAIRKSQKHLVKRAVNAVLSGDTINQASATFHVPKTTVWRHLREMEKQQYALEQEPCYVIVEDKSVHSGTTFEQTNSNHLLAE